VSDQLQFEDEEVSITLRRAWDRALRSLATRINEATFKTHIRAIRPISLTEGTENNKSVYIITLGVPSAFTREWVEKRHASLISGILEEILDRDVQLRFTLTPRETPNSRDSRRAAAPSLFDEVPEPQIPAPTASSETAKSAPASTPPPSRFAKFVPPTSAESAESLTNVPDDELVLTPAPARTGIRERSERPDPTLRPQSPIPPAASGLPVPATPANAAQKSANGPAKAVQPSSGRERASGSSTPDSSSLNPRYTFDNFVVGQSNRLAHAGARAVAQSPGEVYNPLFLYGPSGLGKTHLMHAIGNEIAQAQGLDSTRVAYISGEAFTSNFIVSLRDKRGDEFQRKWRSVDLWLVDDIQFIAGKEKTKEEFFHTFNTLYQTGKQIVISSDRSPRELRMMDERLRSRFESGLIADIATPDLETRLAILHRKAEIERMRIPDDVLLYMAKLIQSNIRTLEGALVKLIAYASLQNSPVTTDLASNILERYFISAGIGADCGDSATKETDSRYGMGGSGRSSGYTAGSYGATDGYSGYSSLVRGVTMEVIQRVVSRRFGLEPEALTGKKRDRDIVAARQIAMHLMRELTEMSLPGIGQLFGGRDHSTVAYACERVKSQIPFDEDLRSLVEDLITQIRAQASG
jgi:chromosomal replication initiator protein